MAHTKRIAKSFPATFSIGMNNEVSQNITQAKDARMMVMASGGTSDDSRYLNTGMLIPKRTFAVNIRMCPLIGLPNVVMDSALYVNLFLLGQEGVFGGIAHRQQAGEFIVIGGSDYLLDFPGSSPTGM